jgi:hypothetical protein
VYSKIPKKNEKKTKPRRKNELWREASGSVVPLMKKPQNRVENNNTRGSTTARGPDGCMAVRCGECTLAGGEGYVKNSTHFKMLIAAKE